MEYLCGSSKIPSLNICIQEKKNLTELNSKIAILTSIMVRISAKLFLSAPQIIQWYFYFSSP